MVKFSSLAILSLGIATASAFTIAPSSHVTRYAEIKSSRFATIEGTKKLVAPSEIATDDIPALFEKFVQKTYG